MVYGVFLCFNTLIFTILLKYSFLPTWRKIRSHQSRQEGSWRELCSEAKTMPPVMQCY